MPRPDRIPVLDPLRVVPHPVRVDHVRAGGLRDLDHAAVDVGGHAGEHPGRRLAEALGPAAAHELLVAADPARADDHRAGAELELADHVPRARAAAVALVGREDRSRHAVDRPVGRGQRVDAMAEAQLDEAVALRLADERDERLDQPRPRAPGDVEARHRVARAVREPAAALGPADVRQEADALRVQPRSLLAGSPVDVGLGPAARPLVLGPVEAGRAEPVLPGELARVPDPQPALLRAVDEEQAAERPERLAAERLLRLLVDEDHASPGGSELRGRDEPGEPCPDDDGVGPAPLQLLVPFGHREPESSQVLTGCDSLRRARPRWCRATMWSVGLDRPCDS